MTEPKESTASKLTGDTPSAISVIELIGSQAIEWLNRHWTPAHRTKAIPIDAIRYGILQLPIHGVASSKSESVGESVVVCSTAEDRYELHCHGGQAASNAILSCLRDEGIAVKSAIESIFETQADRIVAEATLELLKAKTLRTARILMDQKRGALSLAMAQIDRAIERDDPTEALRIAQELRSWNHVGKHLTSPFDVLLCGPPNVGKSSLLNRILGYRRSIVHDQAGTTRDLLVEETSIEGWPVRLQDSAGIRISGDISDITEKLGVQRAMEASASADLQLILVDPLEGWTEAHQNLLDCKPSQSMLVLTKADLQMAGLSSLPACPCISVSAQTGDGIDVLLKAIARGLVPVEPSESQAVLFTQRQRIALDRQFLG
ncbi:MAG: 50S ribosome-binding GTPase [Planctomycetota bacterium]|nr:50S ribosome-binding GTPase [Planctomycetota bacterium]